MKANKSQGGKRKRLRVFIADDSAIVRKRLGALLADLKNVEIVGEAEDVPEAIESITRLKPDVVVLDIKMPGGSGIDVLKTIRQNKVASVVVMFTNYAFPQYRQKCMELGADYFLDKSTEVEELLMILKQRAGNPRSKRGGQSS